MDVVLAAIDETMVFNGGRVSRPIPVHRRHSRYLRGRQLYALATGPAAVADWAAFAQAVNALLSATANVLQPRDIVAIGCHGQTVWHEPTGEGPAYAQIGDNNHIVAHTGITVVGDFRRQDIALGGQRRAAGARFPITRCWDIRRKSVWSEYRRHRHLSLLFPGRGGARVRHGAG